MGEVLKNNACHKELRADSATGKQFLMSLTEGAVSDTPTPDGDDVGEDPLDPDRNVDDLTDKEKLALIRHEIDQVYKTNMELVKKNKELRVQLASVRGTGMNKEARKKVAREFLLPFFTHAQIDCFFRPEWVRHRNWSDKDFETALTLRKLMSKKAFGYLRKKRLVPMPSLTSIRHYRSVQTSKRESTMLFIAVGFSSDLIGSFGKEYKSPIGKKSPRRPS